MAVIGKIIALAVILIYTAAISSKPQYTSTIFMDGHNVIHTQAASIGGIIAIAYEVLGCFIQAVQPIIGADP